MKRFSFTQKCGGETYVYDGESNMLYIRRDDMFNSVDKVTMTERQALKLLSDIMYDTVKPLSQYFAGYGRDSVGTCARCGGAK